MAAMFHFFPGNDTRSQAVLRVRFTGGNPGDASHVASRLQGAPALQADHEVSDPSIGTSGVPIRS